MSRHTSDMHERLRKLLTRAAVLAIGSTQAGCCCSGGWPSIEADYDRSMPEIAALIDRCAANPDDCEPLCRAALVDEFGEAEVEQHYTVIECDVTPRTAATHVRVGYDDGSACGRAPFGLLGCPASASDPTTRWLVRAAYLESASVTAFIHLAADLVRLGAPRELAIAAVAAARDEIRHAKLMRDLCRVPVPIPRAPAYRPATLLELAMLNAVEGCARETIGAALNVWQAQHASDPKLRAAFAQIAPDEIAHAELAWAIHAWVLEQLDATDRVRVIRAQAEAMECVLASYEPGAAELGLTL
jgi:hypothetical protein